MRIDGIVDLTDLDAENTRRLNEIAVYHRKKYTEFVDECSKRHGAEYIWWATPFSTRNISLDHTFLSICYLQLCRQIIYSDNKINRIILDNKALYDTLYLNFAKDLERKEIRLEYRGENPRICRVIKNEFYGIYAQVKRIIRVKLYSGNKKIHVQDSISLIDTPMLSSCFTEEGYQDRYFTDIQKFVERNIYYVPDIMKNTSISWKDYITYAKKSVRYRFMFKENYYNLFDLFYLVRYSGYCLRRAFDKYRYNELDISPLMRDSFIKGSYCGCALEGVLDYRFVKHLRDSGVRVDNLISWYEGRPSEIMMQKAFRKYYPAAHSVGYEGFPLLESSLSFYLSKEQVRQKSAPLTIAVPGIIYEKQAKQFCEKINLIKVPILRNKYVNESNSVSLNHEKKILIVLPYFEKVAREMLHIVNEYMERKHEPCSIIIKNHPVFTGKTIEYYLKEKIYFEPQYAVGALTECLKDINLAYISCSTAALEVISQGVFLVNFCSAGMLVNTGIPDDIDDKLYRVVYDERETFEVFDLCLQRAVKPVNILDIGQLFESVNKETINRMWD